MSEQWPTDLTGFVNFRDLGGHTTPIGIVRHGRVFRSDSLAHAEDEHVQHLVEERGVRTVVDLRGEAEVLAYPNEPMRAAGAAIHHIPLIDPEQRAASDVDWEYLNLVGLYEFILATSGPRFVDVMTIIADPANHPLVFHCAAGKDRAGLVAALTLGLLDVDDKQIVHDYARTAAALDALWARAHARAAQTNSPPAARFMTAEESTMRETLAWLHAGHGTIADYLLGHGLAPGAIEVMRTALVRPGTAPKP
jgi:protein-tyrosine phosphatase